MASKKRPTRAHHAVWAKRGRAKIAAGVVVVALAAGGTTLAIESGPSAYQATAAHLGWRPPRTKVVGNKPYPLVEGPEAMTVLGTTKAATARYVEAAWCAPVLSGRPPTASSLAGAAPAGTPLLVRVPALPAGTHRFCTWVGDYPRSTWTGGTLLPHRATHPVYPADYGRFAGAGEPVLVEYGWTDPGSRGGEHVWVEGLLGLAPVGSRGRPEAFSWRTVGWWSSAAGAAGPSFLPAGLHWNYAGAPIGSGVRFPAGAATRPS